MALTFIVRPNAVVSPSVAQLSSSSCSANSGALPVTCTLSSEDRASRSSMDPFPQFVLGACLALIARRRQRSSGIAQTRLKARRPEDAEEQAAAGAVKGGLGGAVLGGLLLGPFGAVFGAQLGSRWGGARAANEAAIDELGLDEEMISLAQRTAGQLAQGTEDYERVQAVAKDFGMRVVTLETDVQKKFDEASKALEEDNEALARAALAEKLRLSEKLEEAKSKFSEAVQRRERMKSSVAVLEKQALDVQQLLSRAQNAAGAERTALTAQASAFGVTDPRDEDLLRKFDKL